MYTLIIAALTIVIMSTGIAGGIYIIGDRLNRGTARTDALAILKTGNDIASAIKLYRNDNNGAYPTFTDLINGQYLLNFSATTTYGTWDITTRQGIPYLVGTSSQISYNACEAVNIMAGITTVYAGWTATPQTSLSKPWACGQNAGITSRYVQIGV